MVFSNHENEVSRPRTFSRCWGVEFDTNFRNNQRKSRLSKYVVFDTFQVNFNTTEQEAKVTLDTITFCIFLRNERVQQGTEQRIHYRGTYFFKRTYTTSRYDLRTYSYCSSYNQIAYI